MQPDTSLYDTEPDKLRALALCIEAQAKGKTIECMAKQAPNHKDQK